MYGCSRMRMEVDIDRTKAWPSTLVTAEPENNFALAEAVTEIF